MHAVKQIQIDFLWYQANTGFGGFEIGIDAVAEYLDLATALINQRADDAYRCRLAGAIRSQQRIKIAGLDREIYSLKCNVAIGVGLAEVLYGESMHGRAYCTHAPQEPSYRCQVDSSFGRIDRS